jgi:maleamate amidohydrolase
MDRARISGAFLLSAFLLKRIAEEMRMRKWEEIFTEADRALLKKFGRTERQAFGKRPALIIVDVVRSFLGSKAKSTLEAAEEYRTSCGEPGWKALGHIRKLLDLFREKRLPVVYTTVDPVIANHSWGPDKWSGPQEKWDLESWEIAEEIQPLSTEPIIRKTKASAFLFTPLAAILHNMRADSLVVVGTSTSGCVRATVVDGLSYKYNVFVVEECTFDRFELSHLVSLWDMNAKYADVISIDEAITSLTALS